MVFYGSQLHQIKIKTQKMIDDNCNIINNKKCAARYMPSYLWNDGRGVKV